MFPDVAVVMVRPGITKDRVSYATLITPESKDVLQR